MKAYVLHGIGDMRYEEVKEPTLKPGEVLVEVKAAGICGSDIPRIFETGTYSYPLIPGHEFSGVVVKAAAQAEEQWLGKRVGVFPLLPCKSCAPCRSGRFEMCRKYSYFGSRTDGAFAQYVAVPVWNLVELPKSVSFEAAAMFEPMAVAVHAMRNIGLSGEFCVPEAGGREAGESRSVGHEGGFSVPEAGGREAEESRSVRHEGGFPASEAGERGTGEKQSIGEEGVFPVSETGGNSTVAEQSIRPKRRERIAVCGLGTIGILLTMFLREAGAEDLFVIGNKEFQKRNALELGIPQERFFDGRRADVAERLLEQTDGMGVDVFFECIGKNETVAEGLLVTAPGGRIQLVGNPASDMHFDRNTYWKILRNQLTVKGSWNSTYLHAPEDDWHYVLKRLERGRIRPECYITQRFPLKDLEEGLRIMRDKTQEYVKVMIAP